MKIKPQREPFTGFAKLDAGIPYLIYYPNRTIAHVHWGDGLIHHYLEFAAALDSEAMGRELHDAFQRNKAAISKRTVLGYGGFHGSIVYAPMALAVEVRDIVRKHFTRALEIVATRIREQRTYLDELTNPVEAA